MDPNARSCVNHFGDRSEIILTSEGANQTDVEIEDLKISSSATGMEKRNMDALE